MRVDYAILCVVLGTSTNAGAEGTQGIGGFKVSGTHRARLEAISGQARAGFNSSDELLNFRTTLAASYEEGPFKLVAELWDSRAYGGDQSSAVSTNEVNALELVQAYAELQLTTGAKIQAGRFMLNLGSRRLVAADDYRNTTNGYTGLRADITRRSGWQATAIYTLPQQRRPDGLEDVLSNSVGIDHEGFDLVLWGGLVSRARAIGPTMLGASFFHLGERDRLSRPTRDRSLNTASIRFFREPKPARFDLEVEAIIQRGDASASLVATAVRQPVRAWFVHADFGYKFPGGWQPRVSFDYDHASGDKPGGGLGRFDTLFGMRRADLAPAGLYNAIARTNLVSPGVRVEATPDRRSDWFVSYRPMWLASRLTASLQRACAIRLDVPVALPDTSSTPASGTSCLLLSRSKPMRFCSARVAFCLRRPTLLREHGPAICRSTCPQTFDNSRSANHHISSLGGPHGSPESCRTSI